MTDQSLHHTGALRFQCTTRARGILHLAAVQRAGRRRDPAVPDGRGASSATAAGRGGAIPDAPRMGGATSQTRRPPRRGQRGGDRQRDRWSCTAAGGSL